MSKEKDREYARVYALTHRAQINATARARHLLNPQSYVDHNRKIRYGLTREMYEEYLDVQEDACAFCGQEFGNRRQVIDHDHKTGRVRGIVHSRCNGLIALFEDHYDDFIAYTGSSTNPH